MRGLVLGVLLGVAVYSATVFPFVLWSGVDVDGNQDVWGGVFMLYGVIVGAICTGLGVHWWAR